MADLSTDRATQRQFADRPAVFGIVGGSGNMGAAIAEQLRHFGQMPILLGGRDLLKAQAASNKVGGATSALRVDVCDSQSLDDFCARCAVVVNAAGPVCELRDRVAQAALRAGTHYVDVAA